MRVRLLLAAACIPLCTVSGLRTRPRSAQKFISPAAKPSSAPPADGEGAQGRSARPAGSPAAQAPPEQEPAPPKPPARPRPRRKASAGAAPPPAAKGPTFIRCPALGGGPAGLPAANAKLVPMRKRDLADFGNVGFGHPAGMRTFADRQEFRYTGKVDGELLGIAARAHGMRPTDKLGSQADVVLLSFHALGEWSGAHVPPGYLQALQYCSVGAPGLRWSKGQVAYEVTLRSVGSVVQIGWALGDLFEATNSTVLGVGSYSDSWGVDGLRGQLLHNGPRDWRGREAQWARGDVIGVAANLTSGRVSVARNGRWVEVFEGVKGPLFPALSASGTVFQLNLGGPFKHTLPGYVPVAAAAREAAAVKPQLLRGPPHALHAPSSGGPDPIFDGTASDGGPRVVSQFPIAPGLLSLSHPAGACSLSDKCSIAECLAALPHGEPQGVPPGFALCPAPGQLRPAPEAYARLRAWAHSVEKSIAGPAGEPGGRLANFRTPPDEQSNQTVAWLVKDWTHKGGGSGVQPFFTIDAVRQHVTALFQRAPLKEEKGYLPRGRCLLVQRFLSNGLRIPPFWAAGEDPSKPPRRFSVRIVILLVSLRPLVLYWNPTSSRVMLAMTSDVQQQGVNPTAALNAWGTVHTRTFPEFMNWARNITHARGRWSAADVDRFIPRTGAMLHSVVSVHNATRHRAGSFNVLSCDLVVGSLGLRPAWVECEFSSKGRKDFINRYQFDQVFRMITLPEVCARKTFGNWVLCEPLPPWLL